MKTQKEYLERPGYCPKCDSDELEGHSVQIEEDCAFQEVTCGECGARWEDHYVLAGYESREDE